MLRNPGTGSRSAVFACLLAAAFVLLWAGTEASAAKKNKNEPNPSDTGAANGVAHRVATLEAALADTQQTLLLALDQIALLEDQIVALDDQVLTLEGQVADLEARVLALEAAASGP